MMPHIIFSISFLNFSCIKLFLPFTENTYWMYNWVYVFAMFFNFRFQGYAPLVVLSVITKISGLTPLWLYHPLFYEDIRAMPLWFISSVSITKISGLHRYGLYHSFITKISGLHRYGLYHSFITKILGLRRYGLYHSFITKISGLRRYGLYHSLSYLRRY